jgi:hypothetical protein
MNINDRWPDRGNLIAGGSTDFEVISDTILKLEVVSNLTIKN